MTSEDAEDFQQRGFSLMPVKRKSKQPVLAWKQFQIEPPSHETVAKWIKRNWSLGIVTGAVSGIVVVDLDTDDAVNWAAYELPRTPLMVMTPRGEHWYYKHPGVMVPNTTGFIDIRGDGGYVVAPGSLGEDGTPYVRLSYRSPVLTGHRGPRGDRLGMVRRGWPSWTSNLEMPVFDPAWIVKANGEKTMWTRTCQECGNQQTDKEPFWEMTDAYRDRKCKACKSRGSLDFGSEKPVGVDDAKPA